VGEVVEADTKDWIGKRVVGEINLACGACAWCRRDLGRHCPSRSVLGIVRHPGAFREFFTLPERNLHAIPDWIPPEIAVFTEPVAAACEILEQVAIPPGSIVVVPRNATPFNGLAFSERIFAVLSNMAVTAAALAAISHN